MGAAGERSEDRSGGPAASRPTLVIVPRARKRFGQHFLHDRGVVHRIVDAFDPRPGQLIVEIGPGRGILTRELLERAGALHAVEIDRDLVRLLRTQYPPGSGLQLHEDDALEFDFRGLRSDAAKLRIIGNLPYNVSTPLLIRLVDLAEDIEDMIFMLQCEVVDRLTASAGSKQYGRLTVMVQWRYEARRLFDVEPGAFVPAPKVESTLIHLQPRASCVDVDREAFAALVRTAFTQRRKTLRNALKGVASEADFTGAGVDAKRRPETLTVEEFARLSRIVAARRG